MTVIIFWAIYLAIGCLLVRAFRKRFRFDRRDWDSYINAGFGVLFWPLPVVCLGVGYAIGWIVLWERKKRV
jgi:hypothetical protein